MEIDSRLAFLDGEIAEQKASIQQLRIYKKGAQDDKGKTYLDTLILTARKHLSDLRKRRKKISTSKPNDKRAILIGEIASSVHLSLRRYLPRDLNPQILARAAEHVADVVIGGRSREAVSSRHDKAGGSREKAKRVRAEFAAGGYATKTSCAMWAVKALAMRYDTALKALANQPKPLRKNKRLRV